METLARLLGGVEKVKVMRYFLHHEDKVVSLQDLALKTKIKTPLLRKEIKVLLATSFLHKKRVKTYVAQGKKYVLKDVEGFALNLEFPHNKALRDLLFDFQILNRGDLMNRFKAVGRIKLFIVSGIFLHEQKARVDILIVGDLMKKDKAEKIFDTLSSELGREIIYSLMDVEEYEYRTKMYDKFIRDVFDSEHEVVVNKLKITS
jgi:hypothetical protein